MKKNHVVEVFSAVWWPWCTKVKDFLTQNKVEFIERDVDADPSYAERLVEASGQRGIPVTIIDEKTVIVGYNVAELKRALDL